jgi:hypothetical protein
MRQEATPGESHNLRSQLAISPLCGWSSIRSPVLPPSGNRDIHLGRQRLTQS